ncbi:unnamed protein product [Orchesella dallaii]|uniref:Formamidase n=1 Tax=Orchesella dallaii TaxID=48710 RepID=A0ABP1R1Q7_9HEXA
MPIPTIIKVDLTRSPRENPALHNRYHPDIPPIAAVKPGKTFKVECVEWTGGQIKNDDSAEDILNVDLTQAHYLSGPIHVEGAEPGDYLEVEILEIQAYPGSEWGYTAIFDVNNGGGFLYDIFPRAAKTIWDFDGIYCTSRHIPGVKFAGLIHPGIIATAPSPKLLREWNKRESDLVSRDPNRVPPLAYLPYPETAHMGSLKGAKAMAAAKEAPRTIPPREHGGNVDIKNLSRGSKTWLPVYVPGANFSVGDLHFSIGDGELAFCGAIEMNGIITLRTKILKNGVSLHGNQRNPMCMPGPVETRFSKWLTFEGISVDDNGVQFHLDASLSFRQACLNAIQYFKRFGYTGEQCYMMLSAIPVEGRINAIVDVPNALCSLSVPTDVFDFDVLPTDGGHLCRVTLKPPKMDEEETPDPDVERRLKHKVFVKHDSFLKKSHL